MFCPKCGSQNSDGTRYCRGCGTDLSNALAIVHGKTPAVRALAEKHIDIFSSAVRWLIFGVGFLIVSGVSFAISIRLAVLGVFALAFGFLFLGTGIARLVQSKGLKKLVESEADRTAPALPPGTTEFVAPSKSIYETDELLSTPHSVTDHTTKHLELNSNVEEFESRKKTSS